MSSITCLIVVASGCLSAYMLVVMIDEIFRNIDIKLRKSKEEKESLEVTLKMLKSENDELLEKIHQQEITIEDLHTEINSVQPDENLLEENDRLVKTCEKLHLRCDMLKKELKLRNGHNITPNIKEKFQNETNMLDIIYHNNPYYDE